MNLLLAGISLLVIVWAASVVIEHSSKWLLAILVSLTFFPVTIGSVRARALITQSVWLVVAIYLIFRSKRTTTKE
jgi:putative effector of murein hydrolase LrgA (UPF0299 family)